MLVNRIQTGEFDENDIDNLLMKLRGHSKGSMVFREIADFVAHNQDRDRGITSQSLQTMYLMMRYFREYTEGDQTLDVFSPFPQWIKTLMILQVDKFYDANIKDQTGLTKSGLKKKIKNAFQHDTANDLAVPSDYASVMKLFPALQYVLGRIVVSPVFHQDTVISQLLTVLESNRLNVDRSAFSIQKAHITLCIMMLLHDTHFTIGGNAIGHCQLASENIPTPNATSYKTADGNTVRVLNTYGILRIMGVVPTGGPPSNLSIAYEIMGTNLEASQWCDPALLVPKPLTSPISDTLIEVLDLSGDLALSKQFKLTPVPPPTF